MNTIHFKVCVECITFNQVKYITDAMDGFCMQETDFPYVCCIVDDASTDGEQDVINNYLKDHFALEDTSVSYKKETDDSFLTFSQHKTNKFCYFAVVLLKENKYSKTHSFDKSMYITEWSDTPYHALCEGDDYWIAPRKLQKQVDFFESHPDYVMIHTDFNLTKGRRNHYKEIYKDGNYLPGAFEHNGFAIGTLTVMFRENVYKSLPRYYVDKQWPMGDKPLWFELANEGKIKYIPEITANYRVLDNSASHSQDITKLVKFKEAGIEITEFYAEKFNYVGNLNLRNKAYYLDLMRFAYRGKNKSYADKTFADALRDKSLSHKLVAFYLGTKIPILRYILKQH